MRKLVTSGRWHVKIPRAFYPFFANFLPFFSLCVLCVFAVDLKNLIAEVAEKHLISNNTHYENHTL